jgi:uncharacterized protein with PIN domain
MDESVAAQEFLAVNAGAFCDECMGKPLGIQEDELKAAIFADSRMFARTMGRCRECRRLRPVTSLRRAA